ncbi:hypothetical protein LBMAG42_08770 [Deltaproteobacteria bacterium]|nr:hypothetical protein LBMAG42_08770 [Deltaproteobacteria bacterium]
MFMLNLVILSLLGCGDAPAPAPAPTTAPAAAPAPAAPAPVAEAVGPDGPASIKVPEIAAIPTDAASIAAGEKVFADRGCGGCHKFGAKLVGPDLSGIFTRRTIPWVERMISEPGVMVKQDPEAKALFRSLMVEMPKQNVPEADLAPLLAYVKSQGG